EVSWSIPCLSHLAFQTRMRVRDAREIRRARARVERSEKRIAPRLSGERRYSAVRIGQIAERDRLRRAYLLASGLHLSVDDGAVVHLRLDACRVDPLDAVGAFLHDAARSNAHIRIAQEPQARRLEVGVLIEIEIADLVGAVVRAVPRADAAVVDHEVEPFRRVHRRRGGAHGLARRVLAVHARKRLEEDLRLGEIALVVAIDADPVHLAAASDLILSDDGDIVLGLAGDHAGVAADAGAEVDGHAPSVARLARFDVSLRKGLWIERRLLLRMFLGARADDGGRIREIGLEIGAP